MNRRFAYLLILSNWICEFIELVDSHYLVIYIPIYYSDRFDYLVVSVIEII